MSEMKEMLGLLKKYQHIEKVMHGSENELLFEFIEILKSCEKLSFIEFKDKVAPLNPKPVRRAASDFDGMHVAALVYKTRQNKALTDVEIEELSHGLSAKEWKSIKVLVEMPLANIASTLRHSKPSAYTLNQLKWISKATLNIELQSKKKDECKMQLIDILTKKVLNDQLKHAIK